MRTHALTPVLLYDKGNHKGHPQMTSRAEEDEIIEFLRSEQESYYRGDFEEFISHWHHGPEVRRILSGPQVGTRVHIGWDNLCAKFKEGFRQHPQNYDARKILQWNNIQIQKSGDMAWITYDQVATEYHQDMHVSPLSHEVKIIQKMDGKWKIVCLTVAAPGLGRQDVPQVELDLNGKVVKLNALAHERLNEHRSLMISSERPRARNRAFDKGLQDAISNWRKRLATNLPRGFLDERASIVPLGDDQDGLPSFCWVHCEQEYIVLSFDDRNKLRDSLEQGAANFKLSSAQVNVVEKIASGCDLAGAAEELGVSVNTVRTQLRRVFEKTQTHNQATLISRILNSCAPS